MKILLSAFVCQPGLGSEEGVGWGTAWNLAQRHRVHVLTTPRHRAAIERHLADHPCERLSFSYFDFSPALLRVVVTSALWQLYYHAWQLRIAAWARRTAERFDPDVVHHITYGRYWTPSSLWKLQRPFVWGPLGGGDECPPGFRSCLSLTEKLQGGLRSLAQGLAHCDPQLRATARHATIAIASTPATEQRLLSLGCKRVVPLLQMALDRQLAVPDGPAEQPAQPVFCSVGRLLGWKGHALTLRAFAHAAIPRSRLILAGDGPARKRLEALAQRLGLQSAVIFLGNVPRAAALQWIERSTALVHSSFHDQAPTVVFEAMLAGTPVIALGLGGMVRQLTPETGILVEARTVQQATHDMAAAMRLLADDGALRRRLGAAGKLRVGDEFTWARKAEQFCALYDDAIERSGAPSRLEPADHAAPLARTVRTTLQDG